MRTAKDTVNKVRAERTDGLVDERLQAKHHQLTAFGQGRKSRPPRQPTADQRATCSRPHRV